MSSLKIRLDWYRDAKGYEPIDHGKYGTTIVGKGGRLVPTRPLDNDMVFMAFSKVDTKPKLLKFVHQYGLLERPSYSEASGSSYFDGKTLALIKDGPVIYGENVDEHLNTARMFTKVMRFIGERKKASVSVSEWMDRNILNQKFGELSLEFVSGRGFQLVLKADSLISGMFIQLAQKISGGSHLSVCKLCNAPFWVGPGTDRRAHAKFCSSEHKITFHSGKRSKAG